MNCKSNLAIVALFIVSLLLGIATGVLNFLGILQLFSGAIPVIGGIATLLVLGLLYLASLIVFNMGDRYAHKNEKIFCSCVASLIKPALISAVLVIVASIVFISVVGIPVLSAFVMGFLGTFLFFALFLVAQIIACLVDEACCRKPCDCDSYRTHDDE